MYFIFTAYFYSLSLAYYWSPSDDNKTVKKTQILLTNLRNPIMYFELKLNLKYTRSSAIAERPRDASCC